MGGERIHRRIYKRDVFNLKHNEIIYSPPQASWSIKETWPSPCSGLLNSSSSPDLTTVQAHLHHGRQNTPPVWHIPFIQVSPRATFSLLKVPSLLCWFLTAGGKGQPFPPVLYLMENLTKCSERKKIRGKSHNFFSCSFCLWGSRKHWVPTEASNTLGQYPATLNSAPRLLADPGPGEHSSPKSVTSQTRDCQKSPRCSLVSHSPQTQMRFKPSSMQLLLRICFSVPVTHNHHSPTPKQVWDCSLRKAVPLHFAVFQCLFKPIFQLWHLCGPLQ